MGDEQKLQRYEDELRDHVWPMMDQNPFDRYWMERAMELEELIEKLLEKLEGVT